MWFRFQPVQEEVSNACGRVVLVNLASDLAPEQNTLMNLVFAAQQQGVKVDAVSLSGSVPILQQACDIASGSYFEVSESKKLFPMLMVSPSHRCGRQRLFRITAWETSKGWRPLIAKKRNSSTTGNARLGALTAK